MFERKSSVLQPSLTVCADYALFFTELNKIFVLKESLYLIDATVRPEVPGDDAQAPAAPLVLAEQVPCQGEVLDGDGWPVTDEVAHQLVSPPQVERGLGASEALANDGDPPDTIGEMFRSF